MIPDSVVDIISEAALPEWDKELVADAVAKAYEKWFKYDGDKNIAEVEHKHTWPFPGIVDLVLEDRSGNIVIVDWKTKLAGAIDDRWMERKKTSAQFPLYAAIIASARAEAGFRISWPIRVEVRAVTINEKPETKTLKLDIYESQAKIAVEELQQLTVARDALIQLGKNNWPKHRSGCLIYGPHYKCEYYDYCFGDLSLPPGAITPDTFTPFSFSSSEDFLRCPERHRLSKVIGRKESSEDSAALGRVFHSCMAAIYEERRKNGISNSGEGKGEDSSSGK